MSPLARNNSFSSTSDVGEGSSNLFRAHSGTFNTRGEIIPTTNKFKEILKINTAAAEKDYVSAFADFIGQDGVDFNGTDDTRVELVKFMKSTVNQNQSRSFLKFKTDDMIYLTDPVHTFRVEDWGKEAAKKKTEADKKAKKQEKKFKNNPSAKYQGSGFLCIRALVVHYSPMVSQSDSEYGSVTVFLRDGRKIDKDYYIGKQIINSNIKSSCGFAMDYSVPVEDLNAMFLELRCTYSSMTKGRSYAVIDIAAELELSTVPIQTNSVQGATQVYLKTSALSDPGLAKDIKSFLNAEDMTNLRKTYQGISSPTSKSMKSVDPVDDKNTITDVDELFNMLQKGGELEALARRQQALEDREKSLTQYAKHLLNDETLDLSKAAKMADVLRKTHLNMNGSPKGRSNLFFDPKIAQHLAVPQARTDSKVGMSVNKGKGRATPNPVANTRREPIDEGLSSPAYESYSEADDIAEMASNLYK